MAMSIQKPKYIMLRMMLVAILVAIFVWSYILFSENYQRIELSHKMVDALLQDKTELAAEYAQQLGLVQKNLDRTEAFLNDIKIENMKLKEKIKLLDQLKTMEQEISQLRKENAEIQQVMLKEVSEDDKDQEGFHFDTIDKGRSFIRKFKDKIREVKQRIHFLKRKEADQRIAVQKEIDRKESLLGNNGYLVKDGKPMPVSMPDVDNLPEGAKIKVDFVK